MSKRNRCYKEIEGGSLKINKEKFNNKLNNDDENIKIQLLYMGVIIRTERKRNGLSIEQFAEITNLSI